MISTTYEQHELPGSFTFRVVETAKRIEIHSTPRTASLPCVRRIAVLLVIFSMSMISISCEDEAARWEAEDAAYAKASTYGKELYKLAQAGKLDGLLASVQECIESGHELEKLAAYNMLFTGFTMHDRFAELIPILQEIVQKHRKDPEPHIMLGQIYRLQGDMTKAIEVYKKVVKILPKNYVAYRQFRDPLYGSYVAYNQ